MADFNITWHCKSTFVMGKEVTLSMQKQQFQGWGKVNIHAIPKSWGFDNGFNLVEFAHCVLYKEANANKCHKVARQRLSVQW